MQAIHLVQSSILWLALINTCLGSSHYTSSLEKEFQIELQLDPTRRNRDLILEKQGLQLIHLDTTGTDSATKKQFYVAVTGQERVLLRISNVTLENAGRYQLSIYYTEGAATEQEFSLQVHGVPEIFPVRFDAVEGEDTHLTCCVESSAEVQMVWWIDTKQSRDSTHMIGRIEKASNNSYCGQILFTSRRAHNNRYLICQVQSSLNLSVSSPLSVMYQPTVNSTIGSPSLCKTHNCAIREFTNVTIICTTNGNPQPNVTLSSSFRRPPIKKWKYHSMEYINDSTWKWYYFFQNMSRTLHGRYICKSDNGIGSTADDALMLNITFETAVNIKVLPSNNLTLNDNLTINCETYSNPPPSVSLQKKVHGRWATLPNSKTPVSTRRYTAAWKFSLGEANEEYVGLYRCRADNGIGAPAISNTEEILLKGKTEPKQIPWIELSVSVALIAVIVSLLVTIKFYRNRRTLEIESFTRRIYMRRCQPRDSTINFPDVVNTHHCAPTISSVSRRELPCHPIEEDKNITKDLDDLEPPYEKCSAGSSCDDLHADAMDVDGYVRLNKTEISSDENPYEGMRTPTCRTGYAFEDVTYKEVMKKRQSAIHNDTT